MKLVFQNKHEDIQLTEKWLSELFFSFSAIALKRFNVQQLNVIRILSECVIYFFVIVKSDHLSNTPSLAMQLVIEWT